MTSTPPTPILVQTVTPSTPPTPSDSLVTTEHRIQTTEGELCYTARTGRIVLRDDQAFDKDFEGARAEAQIGITAYTLVDGDVTSRPIIFCFNGGPGSASIWLHMGLVGPRIVDLGEVEDLVAPPYRLRDNAHTLLRAADIVVIDAMSTGYSRAAVGRKAVDWHGWKADAAQFAEVIRLWCTREDRWMSPKYLLGESYGTARAVSVAQLLQDDYGLYFNGIILLSSVLDWGNQDFDNRKWDESCIHFLPSYAALAWYHGKHPGQSLDEVRTRAEAFTATDYRLALASGLRLSPEERERTAQTLAELTGLNVGYVLRTNLRIEHERFCEEVLRDQGQVIGRIDGRFVTWARSGTGEKMDTDPSGDLTMGAYAAAWQHYQRAELGVSEEMNYRISAELWKNWNYREFQGVPVNVTDKLERVIQANPHCAIRVEYGFYDLATPYYAAQATFDHLKIPLAAYQGIEHSFFETGHMPYLHEASRIREADEQCAFIRRTSNR